MEVNALFSHTIEL